MAANSNGAPPVIGAGPTPTPPSAPAVPGPNAAGLNPAAATQGYGSVQTPVTQAPASGFGSPAFDQIASQVVPGAGLAGVTKGSGPKPYTDKQLVQSLAETLNVKAKKGEPLEVAVVNELADKYKVPISQRGMTTSGTGTGQGSVGQARHFIATFFSSWVGSAFSNNPAPPTEKGAKTKEQLDTERVAAMKIASPRLRAQAIAKIDKQQQESSVSPSLAQPVPAENAKALSEIVTQVAQKLGVQGTGPNALEDIAKSPQVNAQYQIPGTPSSPGSPQTYAQNFVAFQKAWTANQKLPNGQTFDEVWMANLENAGVLNADVNTASSATQQQTAAGKGAINITTTQAGPDANQVFNAYQSLLVQSSQAKQSPADFIAAQASNPTTKTLANGAPSEMYAYVEGVATEMGVGLTPDQINQISNFYGSSASVADNPSSVEDQIKDSVTALFDPTNPNNPAGMASTMFEEIKTAAFNYQVPISDAQIGQMVKQDLQGATVESMYVAADAAEAAATKQFQEQAAGLYPALADQIKAGQTVTNLVTPYFNVASTITGVPASTMMADTSSGGTSKWAAFLQGGTNPSGVSQENNQTGKTAANQPQMMTLDQWKTKLMQDPQYGFQNTQGAKNMASQFTSAILNEFGKVNTQSGGQGAFSGFNPSSALAANTGGS